MKYRFNDEIYNTREEVEEAIELFAKNNIDEFIDETNEEVRVLGMFYSPSEVLREVDPIAYRCCISDYESILYEDMEELDDEDDEDDEDDDE